MERRRVQRLFENLPAEDGVGMYSFRHYLASNALGNGIPITDVADWMGHKSIEETYRTYRHLMPGSIAKAARILNAGLWILGATVPCLSPEQQVYFHQGYEPADHDRHDMARLRQTFGVTTHF
ncbi:hypothetical protein GCM10010256_36360 [Streptomyces coeruleorubidus]|nr:hypothetical protein GCM10010256_36360 [Streptomyces coeruleorubidus]